MRSLANSSVGLRLALAASLSCAAACGDDVSAPSVVRSGGLELEARLSPAAPRVGANQLELTLREASGGAVSGAHVEAAVRMHPMGAMPGMGGPASVRALGDGHHQADFAIAMGGTWHLEITAHAPGGAVLRAEGSLTVGSAGLRLAAAGGAVTPDAAAPASARPGAFTYSAERIQEVGVRTTKVEARSLARTLRFPARVAFDESGLTDVSTRISGWIESLAVTAIGDPVERGQVLFTIFSPELHAAQLELQQAQRSLERAGDSAREGRAAALLEAAEHRLALLGVAESDIAALAKRAEPLAALPIRAPTSGVVVEKDVVLGAAANAGERLLRIAPRDRIWLEAAIPEGDLGSVREGDAARVRLASDPALPLAGRVMRIAPELSADSRTATARIALSGGALALQPGLWANVEIDAAAGLGLSVPESAVLQTGERSFVFVALGGGRFEPREVTLGVALPDAFEVRSGLVAGEEVVSSGTYLIASESRLRAAISQW